MRLRRGLQSQKSVFSCGEESGAKWSGAGRESSKNDFSLEEKGNFLSYSLETEQIILKLKEIFCCCYCGYINVIYDAPPFRLLLDRIEFTGVYQQLTTVKNVIH